MKEQLQKTEHPDEVSPLTLQDYRYTLIMARTAWEDMSLSDDEALERAQGWESIGEHILQELDQQ